jgi:hypothetical protein
MQMLAAGLGDHEPLALAIEKLHPEFGFQSLDVMAYSALGDEQLLCRPRETFMASGGLEGLQCIERRQPSQANLRHEKNSVRVEKRCFAGNRLLALSVYSIASAHDERPRSLLGVDDDDW